MCMYIRIYKLKLLMILFYSEYCEHCTILLDTIKRHDKNKKIKLLSIDYLRSINRNIDNRIHSVPALMFMPSKELIFGKAVFDHLLLPNRGVLFSDQHSTRDKEKNLNENIQIPIENNAIIDEPSAFTLGSISSDYFSNIDDDNLNNTNSKDKNYNWTSINNSTDTTTTIEKKGENIPSKLPGLNLDDKIPKKLPTMEEILQQREKDIK